MKGVEERWRLGGSEEGRRRVGGMVYEELGRDEKG